MKKSTEKTYQNLIDFIDAAVDSDELMKWLTNLEKLPDNLRNDHLAQMREKMESNRESGRIVNIVEYINNREILSAINMVIKDVYNSGIKTKKYIKNNDNKNFDILINLMAGILD